MSTPKRWIIILAVVTLGVGIIRLVMTASDAEQRHNLEEANATNDARVRYCVNRGLLENEAGHLQRAMVWFSEALRIQPHNQSHQMRIGSTLRQFPALVRLWSNSNRVDYLQWADDGGFVLMCAQGATSVWDTKEGTQTGHTISHPGEVCCAAFNRDGSMAVVGITSTEGRNSSDAKNQLYAWDVATGATVNVTLDSPAMAVAFAADSRQIIVVQSSGDTAVWNWRDEELPVFRFGHGAAVTNALINDQWLITCGNDGNILLWDARTFSPVGTCTHAGLTCVAISQEGSTLITGGRDGMAKVWSLSEDVEPVLLEHQSPVTEVAVSEDGHAITLGDDNRVLTWHLQASIDKPRPEELATGISTCQLTADGRRVLTMGENGDVSLWRTDSGTLEFPTIRGKGSGVRGCVSPSGRRLLVADAGLTRVFDFATNPAYISEVRMGAAVVESETDGVQHLLAVSRDGAGHRIDLRNDLRANAFHHGSPIDTCTIPAVVTPAVATGSSDGLLNVWRGPEWELALCLRFEGAVRRVQCNVSATTFVVAVQDKVHIHSGVPGTDILATLQHKANVNDVAIVGPDEDIVTACEDGSIYVWSGKSHNQIGSSSHESSVFRLGVADQTKYYVSASQEGVRVWDAETHKVTAGALKHDSALSFSECSKTGGYLVTCAIDGTARVWDSRTGEPRTPLLQHQGVTYAAFDWSGVRLATGSRDGIVRLWSCNGGEAVSPPLRHDSPVTHLAFDRMGETLSVACEDGTIRVWDVTPATDEADYLVSIAELWSGAKVDGEVLRELSDDDLHLRWAEIRDSTRKPTLQESLIDRHQEVAQQVFPYQMLTPEPEVRWHLREAATSVDEHRFGAALWHLDRAVSVDPATPGVLRRRAALHQRLGDPEAALADCTRAIEYHQEDASNWVRRARVFGELGDWKSAAKDFALVAKVDAWSANSRADYAFASLIAGDEVSYRRICRQAVDALCETTPQPPPGAIAWPPPAWSPRQNPRATYAIIRVSLLAPETEDFVIELEAWTAKLHELFPECEEHRFIRALALDRLDRFDEALTLLQARPKSDGRIEMPEVWLLLSILQYRLGVLDEGDAAFDKAIEVKRDTDIVDWLRRLQVEELFEEAKQVRLRIRGAE